MLHARASYSFASLPAPGVETPIVAVEQGKPCAQTPIVVVEHGKPCVETRIVVVESSEAPMLKAGIERLMLPRDFKRAAAWALGKPRRLPGVGPNPP